MLRRPPGIEIALLGFLLDGPQHGYQIYQMVSNLETLGSFWRIKQSQLYALLTKLEKDGYISGEIETQATARPPRRMLQLTIKGKVSFRKWLQTPVIAPRLIRQEFMAKYYFARQDGKKPTCNLLEMQSAVCQKWLEALKEEKFEPSSIKWLVTKYRIGQISAALTWLHDLLEELK